MAYLDEELNLYRLGDKPAIKTDKDIIEDKKQSIFNQYYDLASMSYMGGLNSSYLLGTTKGTIIDIDFSSCYPTALSMLQNLTYENSGGIKEFQELLQTFDGSSLPIAMADIEFTFPSECKYPSLPIKNGTAGLFYVLEGRSVCTLPEIHLALEQGCVITKWHDAVVMSTDNSFTFRGFMQEFINRRNEAKRDNNAILQLIFKDYVNGMYGKVAQSINGSKTFIVGKGYSKPLPPSAVTNPYYASMVTGVVRAALSSIVDALGRLDGYDVISATTDGVLYSAPLSKKHLSIENLLFNKHILEAQYESSIVKALESGSDNFINKFEDIDITLYKELLKYPSIRLLQNSRKSLGFSEFIEVKHVATEVTNMKTRGQIGFYEYKGVKYPTVLAKAGTKLNGSKLEQATELLRLYESEEIEHHEVSTLASLRSILDNNDPLNDLVSVTTTVKINTDYDYKRRPVQKSNRTLPFKDIAEGNLYRGCSKHLRNKGYRAFTYRVEYAVHLSKNNVKKRGSSKDFVIRHFLRGFTQGVKPFPGLCGLTLQDVVDELEHVGVTLHKVKEARSRDKFVFNAIDNTATNRKMLRYLLKIFNLEDIFNDIAKIMLFKGLSNSTEL